MFAIHDFINEIILVCCLITSVVSVFTLIKQGYAKAKEPDILQGKKIEELEERICKLEEYSDNDNKKLKSIEQGNHVTQQALLALMSHSLNGNDTEKLKAARDALEHYLVERE